VNGGEKKNLFKGKNIGKEKLSIEVIGMGKRLDQSKRERQGRALTTRRSTSEKKGDCGEAKSSRSWQGYVSINIRRGDTAND